ncbi:MAG: N-acetylmuramoyl-L-alanine amidase [Phormidesmis sp.]
MDVLGKVPPQKLEIALAWSQQRLPQEYHSIVNLYKEHGEKYGVLWSWAFAQACHETAMFCFGGDVKPHQNNFAGIGALGNGNPGESFVDMSTGVLAQIQHLACYAGKDIPKSELVSDRTKSVKSIILGKSKTWNELAGTWAADEEYFEKLEYHYSRIFKPRSQDAGWYRLVQQSDNQKFLVAMSGGEPLFKYAVENTSLSALAKACEKMLASFPKARSVSCYPSMDLEAIPDYEEPIAVVPSGSTGQGSKASSDGKSSPWNNRSTDEPPYFWRRSPNQSKRNGKVTHIVLHNTASSFLGAVSWLCNPESRASAHLVIPRDGGRIAALVPEKNKAWHAGSSKWNDCSIGIEIEATKNNRGMTRPQEELLAQQLNHLLLKYRLSPDKITIHRIVSRTTDCPVLIWPTNADFLKWRKEWFQV